MSEEKNNVNGIWMYGGESPDPDERITLTYSSEAPYDVLGVYEPDNSYDDEDGDDVPIVDLIDLLRSWLDFHEKTCRFDGKEARRNCLATLKRTIAQLEAEEATKA